MRWLRKAVDPFYVDPIEAQERWERAEAAGRWMRRMWDYYAAAQPPLQGPKQLALMPIGEDGRS